MLPRRRHFAPLLFVPVTAVLLLWLFAWPMARLAPRGLDIGLVGPDPAVSAVEQHLATTAGPGAFDVHHYSDQQAARRAVEHHDIYGALVVRRHSKTLLTAPAASPAVASLLQRIFAAPGAPHTPPVKVIDVARLPSTDPHGVVLGSTLLPLLVTSTLGASVASRLTRSPAQRISIALGSAALCGLAAVGITQGWLGVLDGNWVANAGVLALTSLAVASVVAGLTSVCRTAGLLTGAVLMVLVGNAYSGNTSAPELLPSGVAWVGRLLPPGAGASALRRAAFFDGNGIALQMTVLSVWSLAGLALITIGSLRARAGAQGHVHGAHARGKQPRAGVVTERAEAPLPSESLEETTLPMPTVDAETKERAVADGLAETPVASCVGRVQVARALPIGPDADMPSTVGFEVTVVARIDAPHTSPAELSFEAASAG